MRLLDLIEAELRAVLHHDLNDLVRQEAALRGSSVSDNDIGLGHLVHHDEDATAHHRVLVALQDVADLYGMLHSNAFWNMHDERIDTKHRVERHDAVGLVCYLIIQFANLRLGICQSETVGRKLLCKGCQRNTVVGREVCLDLRIAVALHF